MDILVNVVNQKLKIATNLKKFVYGTQNFIHFIFNLSDDWNSLSTIQAQFAQNGNSYNQTLDNENGTFLPSDINSGTCTLKLYGTGNGNIIAKTEEILLYITDGTVNYSGNTSGSGSGSGGTPSGNYVTINQMNAAISSAIDSAIGQAIGGSY